MINFEWVAHRSGVHQMYPAKSDIKDAAGNVLVTVYAVKRPDSNWSLMLINKDENQAHKVRVTFDDKDTFTVTPTRTGRRSGRKWRAGRRRRTNCRRLR